MSVDPEEYYVLKIRERYIGPPVDAPHTSWTDMRFSMWPNRTSAYIFANHELANAIGRYICARVVKLVIRRRKRCRKRTV